MLLMRECFVFVAIFFGSVFASNCGYQSCPKINESIINVHLVAHSHDDVGWTSTVGEYYEGQVEEILDTVLDALKKNSERKFIQVETEFFYEWWLHINENDKLDYKKLVDNGQLEITGGAWSMNDEATAHYQSIIDQFTLGLRVINDTLGECGRPKIGWQIDPFGHSKEMASIFAQLGYDGLFFGRSDFRDMKQRLDTKTAELMWRGNAHIGNHSNIFTHILYNLYHAPEEFCVDSRCSDVIDETNSKYKIAKLTKFINTQRSKYATNNIILTMGGDFHYTNAGYSFNQIDFLIKAFNNANIKTKDGKAIKLLYSTPSCYLKAVHEYAEKNNLALELKTDDFFPYANYINSYWTGFYTSRPTSKRFERQGNNLLQVSKQLATFVPSNLDYSSSLFNLQRIMGIFQHHDAITGTEKQYVANDYANMLHIAMQDSIEVNSMRLKKLLINNTESEYKIDYTLNSCLLSNVSICDETHNDFIVTVYNPLTRYVNHYIRLPVNTTGFTIKTASDEDIPYQISKFINLPAANINKKNMDYDLTFLAKAIPPLGARIYYVSTSLKTKQINESSKGSQYLGTTTTGFTIDEQGHLNSITQNSKTMNITQKLMYYISHVGTNEGSTGCSGAYRFQPNNFTYDFPDPFNYKIYKGALYDEIFQLYSEWATQVIRVYKYTNQIEFDYIIGPIDTKNDGKEVITRFETPVKSGDTFYTDTNGRDQIKRIRNQRETFEFNETSVTSNYYPIVSKILIENEETGEYFSVLNDRAQGGTSFKSGQIEIMLHRRTKYDDSWGVSEPLNEDHFNHGSVARMQHYVTMGYKNLSTNNLLAQEILLKPWVFVKAMNEPTRLRNILNEEFSGLRNEFPKNIHLLSLEPWKVDDKTILIRLEHIKENSEEATIDLKNIFKYFTILSIQEMTLGANQLLSENKKLNWRIGDHLKSNNEHLESPTTYPKLSKIDGLSVTLAPMEIRTFIAKVQYLTKLEFYETRITTEIPETPQDTTEEIDDSILSKVLKWIDDTSNWIKSWF